MKTRRGLVQGHGAQAVVTEDQIIVAAEVTQDANDVNQLHPMLGKAQSNLLAAGVNEPIRAATADAGYWSEENGQAMKEPPSPWARIPKDLSPYERMERKLLTQRGREVYAKRSQAADPVFGQIKEVRGCNRLMRRSLTAYDSEWKLICLTHNLLKL